MEKSVLLCFVVFFVAILTIQAKPTMEFSQRLTIADKCYLKTGMSKDKVDTSILEKRIIVDDPLYPKFLTCYYRGQGFQKDNGDIVPSAIKEMLKDYTTLTQRQKNFVVNDCALAEGKTPSEKAYNTLECIMGRLGAVYYDGEDNSIENNEIDT